MKIPRALQQTSYPAISLLLALLLLVYFYLRSHLGLQHWLDVPQAVFATPIPDILLISLCLIIVVEMRWLKHRRRQQQQAVQQLRHHIDELLSNKKQLNTRAHIYANHADKLKLFISDKLLEYIEYDEKFLHFKSIASEVRHNGIISYDKVSTALQQQLKTVDDNDQEVFLQLQEAQDSLRYLWDLLDLSTADNIALHIANQVCEAEELLFQEELSDAATLLPEKPVFDPQRALEKAIGRCFGSSPIALPVGDDDSERLYLADHDHVSILCQPTTALLGNENHLVLALENIIHNAQFFAGKATGQSSIATISIALDQQGESVRLRIYNRGPLIGEATASKLFQLGFSTRRAREHHGKGLGLYFVSEIIKGYDGSVSFKNIENTTDVISLRITMHNGEVITDIIELLEEQGKARCRKSGDHNTEQLQWQLYGDIATLEVTHQSTQQTTLLTCDNSSQQHFTDPEQPLSPRWLLSLDKPQAATSHLQFHALNRQGVQFELLLPSLRARLEGDYLHADEQLMEQQLNAISGQFKTLED